MAGPKLQPPGPLTPITQEDGTVTIDYASFFHVLQNIAFYSTRSGPTSTRPTSSSEARWIGMPFFDTSLSTNGLPVFLAIASSNTWVDGTGAVR